MAISCRYKDNNSISLRIVKNRLKGIWLLQEAIVLGSNNFDLIHWNPNVKIGTLNIVTSLVGNQIVIKHIAFAFWVECELKNNKEDIYVNDESIVSDDKHLTNTKLTYTVLWVEGNPMLRLCYREPTDEKLKLKYIKNNKQFNGNFLLNYIKLPQKTNLILSLWVNLLFL